MKTWHWVLILVVAIAVVVNVLLWDFIPHKVVNQYEVFRDLLSIILAVSAISVAVLGIAIYKLISLSFGRQMKERIDGVDLEVDKKVKKEVSKLNKRIECEKDSSFCDLHLELSIIYWTQYEKTYDGNGKIKLNEQQKASLDSAIRTGEETLREANKLDEKDFKGLICAAKNNLAYHLAVRGLADDFQRVLDLAKYVYAKASDFDYRNTCSWVETYAFSLVTIGKARGNDDQVEQGLSLIKGLIQREELGDRYRKYIKKKYRNLL